MTTPLIPNGTSGRLVPMVAVLVIIFAALASLMVGLWVASDAATNTADRVGVVVAVIGLAAAVGAVIVAWLTIRQQQIESRRQRQMETLHLVNEQYDRIFDDIYELRARVRRTDYQHYDPDDLKRAYNRFFTALMAGFRYYQLSLIPREDFQEWTATLIGRFVKRECIVRAISFEPCPLLQHWAEFDSWGRGPRVAFRAYMRSVREKADIVRDLPEEERAAALIKGADSVVEAIAVAD